MGPLTDTLPAMQRTWLVLATLGCGCGPLLALPEGEAGTDGTSSTSGFDSGDDGGDDDGPFSSGPMVTSSPGTSGFGSSGGTSGGEVPMCWVSQPLFEVPMDAELFLGDQDGDGDNELWLSYYAGGGPDPVSELFRVADNGQPEPAGAFPGFFSGLHDIDGDGLLDGLGFAFGDGGPPIHAFMPGTPTWISGPLTPTTLGFEDGFDGFFDVTGDGRADFLRSMDDTKVLELMVGDGNGGFVLDEAVTTPIPFAGDASAIPTDPPGAFVLSRSTAFSDPTSCIENSLTPMMLVPGGFVGTNTSAGSDTHPASVPLLALGSTAEMIVYARGCDPMSERVTLQVHHFVEGSVSVSESEPGTFAALGDFDGDGENDIARGDLDAPGVWFERGQDPLSFQPGVHDEVPFGEPFPNRVYTLELDGDGRDEIILGSRFSETSILLERLDLEPC